MKTADIVLTINGHQFDAVAHYEYEKGCKGATEDGLQIEPDVEPYVNIYGVFIAGIACDVKVMLPKLVMDDLEAEILEEI